MDDLVPVIDISRWGDGPAAQAEVAAAVDHACRTVGFLQVTGHGVPDAVLASTLDALDGLWDLPEEAKAAWRSPSAEINRGYAPLGDESLSYSLGVDAPPDLFEAFNIGPDVVPDEPAYQVERHRFFAENIWPAETPSLRPALVAYFDEVVSLAHRLTTIFARALGLPDGFFEAFTAHSTDTLRAINYVRRPGSPDPLPGQLRMGAHTDYGIVTVLWADPVPGLQIVGPDGAWHDVLPAPGALLVNLGDLLAEWTNDRWRSTVHRVVPPPAGIDGPSRRRSIAFFHDGDHDALVEVLATCTSEDDPPRYAPVLAGEHLMAKLVGPRNRELSTATSTLGDRAAAVTS